MHQFEVNGDSSKLYCFLKETNSFDCVWNQKFLSGKTENGHLVEIDDGYTCLTSIDKSNWLGSKTYGDTFSVSQFGHTLTVRRTDSSGGWGMDLKFKCCEGKARM